MRYCELFVGMPDAPQKKVLRGLWRDGVRIATVPEGVARS